MGLQKGQSGYIFRWLMPIFSLVGSLMLFVNALFFTLVASGVDMAMSTDDLLDMFMSMDIFSAVEQVITILNIYVATIWIGAILLLALAILGFVMNKKGSYIFAVPVGGITALAYLVKGVIYFIVYNKANEMTWGLASSELKPILLIGVYMLVIFAVGLCVCLFGGLAIGKCDYANSSNDVYMAGQVGGYDGINNNPTPGFDHPKPVYPGPYDPYAPPINPDPAPYVPQGPTGVIVGVKGMYRDARFTITDNEEIVIGRDPRSAQIVIGEGAQNVSRQHCRIAYNAADDSYRINDMSKNGTFSSANKARLPYGVFTKVPAGTEIYLGDRSNTFRLG